MRNHVLQSCSAGPPSPAHNRAFTGLHVVLLCAIALLAAGCQPSTNIDYERQLQVLRETVSHQKDDLAAQKATIDTLTQRLNAIRGIKPEDLETIFYPVKLVIDSLSGGYDFDNRPGDDGVVVYLKPMDSEGDTLKVAGEIHIQLYDLAAAAHKTLLGEYKIPVAQARELWYGKLMTNHYTIKCPWPHAPPTHPEITIRATFIDFLTQRVISAQSTCTVKLPP